jgi:hypothetical protein
MNVGSAVARWLTIYAWEFLQNVGPLIGLAVGAWLYAKHPRAAMGVVIAGGILGGLAIEITEPLIYNQPPSFVLGSEFWVNSVIFSILGIVGVVYLSRPRRHWRVDVGVGSALAFVMGVGQALFDGSTPLTFVAHLLAMSATFALILFSLRYVLAGCALSRVVLRTLLLNALGSLIIVGIDYTHLIV